MGSYRLKRATHVSRRFFMLFLLLVLSIAVQAQKLPSFCEQVSQDQLKVLPRPYSERQTAEHSSYCEGMLTTMISAHPAEIVSAKYEAADEFRFAHGANATLSWCTLSGVEPSTHLSLRAVKPVSYALDAQANSGFSWNSDLVAFLHPDYSSIAALATSSATVQSRRYDVVLPVRHGSHTNGEYTFIVHSPAPQIQLVEARIESLSGAVTDTLPMRIESASPNYWIVRLSLGRLPAGIYRLYLRDDPTASGLATTPIYFVHGGCS